jgi:SAM-dependent methyltransferase
MKRVQALRYFTWRWTPERLRRGSQGRYLLRHTSPIMWIRALLSPSDLSARAWEPATWTVQDRWLYVAATRLLWEVASTQGSSEVLALEEPALGGPFPVSWRGRLISQDLANTALEVRSISDALEGRSPRRILEVGAGYGRTAHALLSIFPDASYTIIDIPPALEISRWYLTSLFPDRDLEFFDAHERDSGASFDLAVSISSLAEMARSEIDRYLALFAQRGAPGSVVYLKQWAHWYNPVDRLELKFSDYVPPGGRELFIRRASVQSDFLEGAWRIG